MSAATPPAAVPHGYRPALDGIRGVAIVLVVLDHVYSDPPIRVGGTGVALFFALSGYLITGLLLDEHARTGAVRLGRFYLRRAARLLPALLLAVLVCDVLLLLAGDRASVKASVWGLAYVANYVIAWRGYYLPGWAQTWSLAVEEHFYLVWPLLLLLLLRLLRGRPRRLLLAATLALAVGSMLWRGALLVSPWFDTGSLVLYTGSLARADALLYGCAAAVAVRAGLRVPAFLVWPATALLVVLTLLTGVTDLFATLGLALVSVCCAGIVLAVDAGTGTTRARRALSWRPLVLVGVVSYGLYLWHYPLIYVAFALGPGESMAGRAVAGILVTALAATASYRWVEKPVRTWVRAHEDELLGRLSRTRA